MTWKRWLVGILWILVAPTVVVAAFAAMTLWANARPQEAALRVAVEPQIVWPWQDTDLRLTAVDPAMSEPLPPVDLVFLVDISGSMIDSLPAMADAVRSVAAIMPRGPEATRFALIRFDTEAEIVVPWTDDASQLDQGLAHLLPPFTGQNETRAAFDRLGEVLASARSKAERVVVWYTDGFLDICPPPTCLTTMSYDEIAAAAGDLRSRGVQLFAIAPPSFWTSPHEVLQRMTGPGRVLEPRRSGELTSSFERIGGEALHGWNTSARLEQRLDVRHFEPVRSSFDWRPVGADTLVLETALFPGRASTSSLTFDPESMGWWSVGKEPALLVRPDDAGGMVEERAGRRPTVLVLSWWTLFWVVFPALLWGFLHRPARVAVEKKPLTTLPGIRSATLPGRLPRLPAPPPLSLRTIPTLFIGIGGHGRLGLEAIRGELGALPRGSASLHRFLAFDVDRRTAAPEAATSTLAPVELHLAPPVVTDVSRYLPEPGRVPAAWQWFDPGRYHDAPREQLDLAGGARGDRALGRLALFRWLAEGGILEVLRAAIEDLVRQDAAGDLRQVVVVASADGGWGGGTFIDWGRLLKRLGRRLQLAGITAVAPEIVGLLVDDPDRPRPDNRRGLDLELESAQATGAHPFETAYGDAPELRQVDGEPPYHAVIEVRGENGPTAADQAAHAAVLLAETSTRTPLVDEIHSVRQAGADRPEVVRARVQALQLLPAIERERRRLDVLARLLGPDVLLDFQVSAEGKVQAPAFTSEFLDERLAAWARSELRGAPLALLLAACSGRAEDRAALAAAAGAWPGDVGTWLRDALRASVDRMLHGQAFADGWRRGFMPAEAAAVLRRFAHHLEGLRSGTGAPASALRELAPAACAEALEGWLEEAALSVARVSEQRLALELWQRRLQALNGREVILPTAAERDEDIREIFAQWLGSIDTVSALREHLFPALLQSCEAYTVVLRDHLEAARVYAGWQDVEQQLDRLAAGLADSRPVSRLGRALLALGPEERRRRSATLVDRNEKPDRVLLAVPRTEPGTAEARAIAAFAGEIPQPADHGARRRDVESGDATSIRRLALTCEMRSEEGSELALTSAPEQQAEQLRRRLERQHRRRFPTLPVPLRIALAHPEAFAGFADAYQTGRVVRRRDGAGREQWYALETQRFLTSGAFSGLSDAAATYTATVYSLASGQDRRPADGQVAGDFSAFEHWLAGSEAPSADVLALAAIGAFATRQP